MPVSKEKVNALLIRMKDLGVEEKDFQESFIRSSGPGGQKVNKSASCVLLVHLPTGLFVKCQKERSQSLNRFLARRMLLDKIEKQKLGWVAREKALTEKIRRQKRKRSQRAKEKMLQNKHYHSKIKSSRRSVCFDEDS